MQNFVKILSIMASVALGVALLDACHTVDASNDTGSTAPSAASEQTTGAADNSDLTDDADKAANEAAAGEQAAKSSADSGNSADISDHATNDTHLSPDDIPENLIGCEVKIQVGQQFYSAMGMAISIEEALDHAVYEACAVSCAETTNAVDSAALSDDDKEAAISKCTDVCSDSAIPADAECIQNGQTIFTGGSFNEPAGPQSDDAPDAG